MDDYYELDIEYSGSAGDSAEERPRAAFLLTAKDKLTAEAYEEMLKKRNIDAIVERCEPTGPYAAAIYECGGMAAGAPVNIYVPSDQLGLARNLVEEFNNQPIIYNSPPPVLNRKSRINQILFALAIFLIFVVPIGVSLYVIGTRIIRFIK